MVSAMFDGFYGQAIAFVSPAIAKDWNLPAATFGTIFSVGLVGLIIGAVVIAPLGDRTNRRTVAILGAVAISVFTLATSLFTRRRNWRLCDPYPGSGSGR